MEATQTEATCRFTVTEEDENGDRLLTGDEMTEFASDFADHLIDDERTIDPIVSATVSEGAVEVVFGFSRPVSERDTSVAIFDIIHDAGKALGCVWRNEPVCKGPRRKTSPTTRKLTRESQHIQAAAELVDA